MYIGWGGGNGIQWETCLRKFGLQLDSRLLFGQPSERQRRPRGRVRDRKQKHCLSYARKRGLARRLTMKGENEGKGLYLELKNVPDAFEFFLISAAIQRGSLVNWALAKGG